MKNTDYYKSGEHSKNVEKARNKAAIKSKELKVIRIKKYNESPILCKQCNTPIEYDKRNNKFCSKSCSATHNNKGRVVLESQKKKVSERLTGTKRDVGNGTNICGVITKECKVCGSKFAVAGKRKKRKTCSKRCATIAITKFRTYQNGSRKTTWFFNPNENKDVLLESSWEVRIAELLVDKDIKWTRPDPIDWIDNQGKEHLYYPDFYLNDYDIYLDPKNPYCMEQDKEKMEIVSREIKLIFGDIMIVKEYILSLV